MNSFRELKDIVKQKGFGSALYGNVNGEPVYLSRGIREVFCTDDEIQNIIHAVHQFQSGSYGDAKEHGKEGREGHEYGRYNICSLEVVDGADNGVWIHRAEQTLLVYFKFER